MVFMVGCKGIDQKGMMAFYLTIEGWLKWNFFVIKIVIRIIRLNVGPRLGFGDFGSGVTIVDAVKAKVGFGWETNDRGSRVKR